MRSGRWGPRLVDRLDGEFAPAVWDAARARLLLARDPLGARPLFYRLEPERTPYGHAVGVARRPAGAAGD